MTIACTRCGATEDGEIITAPIAFAFKHAPKCGHGVGPLRVIRGKFRELKNKRGEPKEEVKIEKIIPREDFKTTTLAKEILQEIKVEEKPKEKIKVFGSQDKKEIKKHGN